MATDTSTSLKLVFKEVEVRARWEKLSMENTIPNTHYIIGFLMTLMRPDYQKSTLAILLWATYISVRLEEYYIRLP